MTSKKTITLTRSEYDALVTRCDELEDRLAAIDADSGVRVSHEIALAILGGKSPMLALRNHRALTLRELSETTGLAVSYLSEIERGRKMGSASALARIADALETTIDALLVE